jgi:hypothetical protein
MGVMKGVILCVAVAACALLLPATAAARPFTDVSFLTPVNGKGERLQTVRRGRPVTVIVGFRMSNAPRMSGYRVRVSVALSKGDDRLIVRSARRPVVYTGVYRYRLPLVVPATFATGRYMLRGIVEVLEGKRVVAKDFRLRDLRVR